jgi:hypothetical protein
LKIDIAQKSLIPLKADLAAALISGFCRTPGVNFNNILRAAFLYEGFLRSFYVLTIWVCNFSVKGF